MSPVTIAYLLTLLTIVTISLIVLWRLDPSISSLSTLARKRLHYGVPWGSIVVLIGVLAVYLFVQDGISDWDNPVTIPYRSWSYFYPTGMLTSSFAHVSERHLISNLTAAALVAPIAEYAWGHYPDDRTPENAIVQRPWSRALVVFPVTVFCIGIVLSLFSLGPSIGFSGIVFAFVGFAIVRYPITTLVAYALGRGVVSTVYRSLEQPVLEVTAQPSPPSVPSWATTAIQGHALGLFIGLTLAIVIFYRRERLPSPARFWVALVLFAFTSNLWAIYWIRGGETFVLYRAVGIVVVLSLAIVITAAIFASETPLISRGQIQKLLQRIDQRIPGLGSISRRVTGRFDRSSETEPDHSTDADSSGRLESVRSTFVISRQYGSILLVLLVLGGLIGMAVPVNVFVLDDVDDEGSIQIEDYTITYAEDVENELTAAFNLSFLGEETVITSSGVIVKSEDRNIWLNEISSSRLAFTGSDTITLGGIGWREEVTAVRNGWVGVNGNVTYQVWLQHADESPVHVHAADPITTGVTVDDTEISIHPVDGTFYVSIDDEIGMRIPDEGESVEVDDVRLFRSGGTLYLERADLTIPVASKETYR